MGRVTDLCCRIAVYPRPRGGARDVDGRSAPPRLRSIPAHAGEPRIHHGDLVDSVRGSIPAHAGEPDKLNAKAFGRWR